MKMMPLADGRIAITYSAAEDAVLEDLRIKYAVHDSREVAGKIFVMLSSGASNPALVEAIGRLACGDVTPAPAAPAPVG